MVQSFSLAAPGTMAARAAGIYRYRLPGLLSMPGRIFTRVEMLCQLSPICGHALRDFNDVRRIWLSLQRNRPRSSTQEITASRCRRTYYEIKNWCVKLFRRPL
jgi:hypothetical protein